MDNELVTPFWKNALQSLPAEVRHRHLRQIEQAERWELRLASVVEGWSRAKAAFPRMFQARRSAH